MSDALFYSPEVLKVVRQILVSRGLRADADLEDGIGEVVLAAIERVRRSGRPVEDVAQAVALARRLANAHGADEARKRATRGKSNLGPTGDADETAASAQPSLDPVDQQRMLAAIRQVLKDDQIEALADVGVGVQQSELAAEGQDSAALVRKRVQRSREKALGALGAKGYLIAGGFAALLAGMVALYIAQSPDADVVTNAPKPAEQAERERRDAADACHAQRWDACERALDRAAKLDPAGDRAEAVQTLRAVIAAGRRAGGGNEGGGSPH